MADRFPSQILDAFAAGLIVLDRNQHIVQWNAWMVAASSYSADLVLGKRLTQIFPNA